MSPPASATTQRIHHDESDDLGNMHPRCIQHLRRLDNIEGRLETLEETCEDLKRLPAQVASIATTLRIQTAILAAIAAPIIYTLVTKVIEKLIP
jgi:archaellum component FlaC